MSCEIFCCEIDEILTMLVDENNGELLDKLLSILDGENCLDNYLAGYFEKIVEMLLRTNTGQTIDHLNKGGIDLFKKFVKHVNNYSVMQIIQRLMLPHFSMNQNDQDKIDSEETFVPQCNWSFSDVTCEILCSTLVENSDDENRASHISDLLITVLQLSPPESVFIANLCSSVCLEKLFPVALGVNSPCHNNLESNTTISALSVLESLTARLCESLNAHDFSGNLEVQSEEQGNDSTKQNLENLREALKTYIPHIATELSKQIQEDPKPTFIAQDKCSYSKLGLKALQLVKFVESIVRLSDFILDEIICSGEILQLCVRMMFEFELNSLLHLSVQRIICMILEGGVQRKLVQKHLIDECRIVEKVSSFFKEKLSIDNKKRPHIPVTGHVVSIVQTILNCIERSTPDASFDSSNSTYVNESNDPTTIDGNESLTDRNLDAQNSLRGLLTDKMEIWNELLENSYREYVTPSVMPMSDETEYVGASFSGDALDEFGTGMMTSSTNNGGAIVVPGTKSEQEERNEEDDDSDSDSDDEFVDNNTDISRTAYDSTIDAFATAASGDAFESGTNNLDSDDFFSDNFADFKMSGLPQQDDFANFDASFETNFDNISINADSVDSSVIAGTDLSNASTSTSSSDADPFGDKVDVSILK